MCLSSAALCRELKPSSNFQFSLFVVFVFCSRRLIIKLFLGTCTDFLRWLWVVPLYTFSVLNNFGYSSDENVWFAWLFRPLFALKYKLNHSVTISNVQFINKTIENFSWSQIFQMSAVFANSDWFFFSLCTQISSIRIWRDYCLHFYHFSNTKNDRLIDKSPKISSNALVSTSAFVDE